MARGRKSEARLAIVVASPAERPSPPGQLGDAEAEEWRQVAARMPVDWFTRETWPLLEAYCSHAVSHRALSVRIREWQAKPADASVKLFADLLKMRDREVRAMTSLATKLRLTNQSRYDHKTAETAARKDGTGAAQTTRPWDFKPKLVAT
jgi:phage terminase small subunit